MSEPDRADEIAAEVLALWIEQSSSLGRASDILAAALRAYGDEALSAADNFVVEAAMTPEVRRDLRKRILALKSKPEEGKR